MIVIGVIYRFVTICEKSFEPFSRVLTVLVSAHALRILLDLLILRPGFYFGVYIPHGLQLLNSRLFHPTLKSPRLPHVS
jgi:hypothetical protein